MADVPTRPPYIGPITFQPERGVAGEPLECYYVFFEVGGDITSMEVIVNGETISTCCNGPIKVIPVVPSVAGSDIVTVRAVGPDNVVTALTAFPYD